MSRRPPKNNSSAHPTGGGSAAGWDRLRRESNDNPTALLDWCQRAMDYLQRDVERLGGDWNVESKALSLVLAAFGQAVAARADAAILTQLAVPPLPKSSPFLPVYAPMTAMTGWLKLLALADWCRHAHPTKHLSVKGRAGQPELDSTASAALAILKDQKGRGLVGKEIVKELQKKEITIHETTFRRHVVPQIKAAGVRNAKARGGYYWPQKED